MEKHFCLDDSPTFRMTELNEVDSTNNFLRHFGAPHDRRMTLVTAEYQTAGRGTSHNSWESERGKNLTFSLRVMPESLPARRMFAVSEAASLAVADALEAFLPTPQPAVADTLDAFPPTPQPAAAAPADAGSRFRIKWPNDIYYGNGKIAGILIENDLQGAQVIRSTIGIGINVNQRKFLSDAPNPCSLANITGTDTERRFVLEHFMLHITRRMQQISEGRLDELHQDYLARLYRKDQEHHYSDAQGTFRAVLTGVEPGGHLILRDDEGNLRRYAFKEVKHIL